MTLDRALLPCHKKKPVRTRLLTCLLYVIVSGGAQVEYNKACFNSFNLNIYFMSNSLQSLQKNFRKIIRLVYLILFYFSSKERGVGNVSFNYNNS